MTIKEFAQHLAVKKLSDNTMKAYLRYYQLFDEGLNEQELSQGYINQFILTHTSNVTRAFLKNLFEMLEIMHLKIPKLTGRKPSRKRRSLTLKDIKILRHWIYTNKNIRFLLCLDLSYYCALRRAEVIGILIKDFDIQTWAEDPKRSCRLLIHGKGKKERFVPVPPKIMQRIIDYIADQDKGLDDRLFTCDAVKWHRVFKDAIKNTMDYNFTLHDLRRSRATHWIEKGIDVSRVKERLGHASIQTTQVYVNLDEKKEFNSWADEN